MIRYPIVLEEESPYLLVSFPDFPENHTFGDDLEDALAMASDCLGETIANLLRHGEAIPFPSQGEIYADVPVDMAVKLLLHYEMRTQGIDREELARRLEWPIAQVDEALHIVSIPITDEMLDEDNPNSIFHYPPPDRRSVAGATATHLPAATDADGSAPAHKAKRKAAPAPSGGGR